MSLQTTPTCSPAKALQLNSMMSSGYMLPSKQGGVTSEGVEPHARLTWHDQSLSLRSRHRAMTTVSPAKECTDTLTGHSSTKPVLLCVCGGMCVYVWCVCVYVWCVCVDVVCVCILCVCLCGVCVYACVCMCVNVFCAHVCICSCVLCECCVCAHMYVCVCVCVCVKCVQMIYTTDHVICKCTHTCISRHR